MRYFPRSLTQPGLGGTYTETIGHSDTYLVQQMHALTVAITQAKERGDRATVSALLDRFTALANEYRSHGDADLTGTDRYILAVGNWVDGVVSAIPDATAALPKAIAGGIFKAVLPFAAMYLGFLWLKGRK